jgi:hypothetical protein
MLIIMILYFGRGTLNKVLNLELYVWSVLSRLIDIMLDLREILEYTNNKKRK